METVENSISEVVDHLNGTLEAGGTVLVTTYLKCTEYKRRHAGMFFSSADGKALRVKHGRKSVEVGRYICGRWSGCSVRAYAAV